MSLIIFCWPRSAIPERVDAAIEGVTECVVQTAMPDLAGRTTVVVAASTKRIEEGAVGPHTFGVVVGAGGFWSPIEIMIHWAPLRRIVIQTSSSFLTSLFFEETTGLLIGAA